MSRHHSIMAALLGVICVATVVAQGKATFEVASVKENVAGPSQRPTLSYRQPERFVMTNTNVESLVLFAYDTQLSKITNIPAWAESARFDINAKSQKASTIAEKRQMLQTLLEERFHLKLHFETSEGDIYHLTVKTPGKLGPNVQPTSIECAEAYEELERNGYTQRPCNRDTANMTGNFRFIALTMQRLADGIAVIVERKPIIDRTGVAGRFDIFLNAQVGLGAATTANDQEAPSIFTALEEQAGLKLEPQRGPIRTVVVDAVERPIPD